MSAIANERARTAGHARAPEPRLPPGQVPTSGFPVISVGTTPHTPRAAWSLLVTGEVGEPRRFDWRSFRSLPTETIRTDIHAARGWSKLDTVWKGVSLDVLLEGIDTSGKHLIAWCDGGYSVNLSLDEITERRAWVVFGLGGRPLTYEHGGPARLLVPHLYLRKSAKWLRRLVIQREDRPGFWEERGVDDHGDPWRRPGATQSHEVSRP